MTGVVHVINSLRTGGAETQLAMYLRNSSIRGQRIVTLEPGRTASVRIPGDVDVDVIVPRLSSDVVTLSRLTSALRATARDSVVCCWDFRPFVLGSAAGKLARRRTVANVRNMGFFYNAKHRLAERVAFRLVDVVVTNSLASERRIAAVSPRARTRRVPNGVEACTPTAAEPGAAPVAPSSRLTLVCVGRLDPIKGQTVLLDAFERCADLSDLELVFVGRGVSGLRDDGPSPALRRVRFIEDTDNVLLHLCESDLYVMPSLSEGMPNALMEALACGLPAIATDVPGVEDLLAAGAPIRVVPPGDAAALEAALRAADADRASLAAEGRRAADAMTASFSPETMAAAYDDLFAGLARGGSDG